MLIVPLEEARKGMRLALAVTHPEHPEQELLRPGFTLTDDVLERLRDMGVGSLYVDYPDLGDLDRHMAGFLSPARQAIYQQVRDAMTEVQRTARPTIPFTAYYDSTRELIHTLMDQGQNALFMDQVSGGLGARSVAHATAVAHLALVLGLRLEPYLIQQRKRLAAKHAREVVSLGVAGMLHDLGLSRLPESLRTFSRTTPPENEAELAEWRTHPQVAYDMVRGSVEASAAAAVLHHHQHFDGSGFPRPPADAAPYAGERVHVFARILAAADLLERLRVDDAGRTRPNLEVLHIVRTRYAHWLDPVVLDALPAVVPPFPPGTRVTLSDGTEAFTVSLRPDRPYEPTVKRILDPQALRLAPESLDLAQDPALSITRVAGTRIDHLAPASAGSAVNSATAPTPARPAA